ncbi:MAG: hypothetical protein PHV28_02275 [Kiritimatiellae bacterium]|nr:hypothetical protein [Kiritimatiellia bacterium]
MRALFFVLAASLFGTLSADVTFTGKYADLTFDDAGALASIREKGGRELVGERCPFMDVTLKDGRIYPSTATARNADGALVFRFAPLEGECVLTLIPFDGGWTLQTVSFTVPDAKTLTIAHVKPGCKKWYGDMACLVSDECSGVALRAYDPLLRTACDDIPNTSPHSLYDAPDKAFYPTPEEVVSGLMIRADAPDSFVGKKCGLCAGPREALKPMLKAMTLVAGVPHSKAGGAWAQECEANRGSYLFTTLMDVGSIGDWIEMAELGGFTTVHPYAWWVLYGTYAINPEMFPNGLKDLKAVADKFHAAGLRVDVHHLSHCIQYLDPIFMPEFTVEPGDVIMRRTYTLARPFAPGDTELYINEEPWDGHTVIMKSHANGNALLIGKEIVQYHDMSWKKPYCFSKISRGAFGTQYHGAIPIKVSACSYPVGTKVYYFQQRYGSFYPKPGSKLMQRVSDRIGRVFNACKGDGVYFDGAEGMMTVNGTEVGRETTFRQFRQKDGEIVCESACLYPYSWWYRSRIGPWDHAEWGAKRFVDEHIKCLDEYAVKANLLKVNLGWWSPMMGCHMARQHFSDEMEYNGCKGAAIDAADGFQLPDPSNSVNRKPVHFHTEQQLAIFGKWERARLAKAFSDETLAKIRVPGDEFRLAQDAAGLWRVAPQQVTCHRVADANRAQWTADEPETRKAEIRVEALYGGNGYTAADSESILAPSDVKTLEVESAKGVKTAVAAGADAEKGALLAIDAENANPFANGAWARVGKHYPIPFIAVTNAVGLWVKGDRSGALLNVQIEQSILCYHGYSEHYIRLDFNGWRYFALQLRERDAYDYFHQKWPYAHYRINTATEVYRTEIMGRTVERVNLYLNDIPAGGKAHVEVTDVRSIGRHAVEITDAVVTLNGRDIPVPFTLKSTQVAEFADGVWTLIGDNGSPIAKAKAAPAPGLKKGANQLAWRAQAKGDYPRVEVTLISVGQGEPAFKPGATASEHLKYEAEYPLIHAPSKGMNAAHTVKVRPGETARLEIRLLGPISHPAVTIDGETWTFPVDLADNDCLRCYDGRNWDVRRIVPRQRLVVAKGALAKEMPFLKGKAEVCFSSDADAGARARVSLAKRYVK